MDWVSSKKGGVVYQDLRPCVRCKGTGVIQVNDFSDPYALIGGEWPRKDAKCHGCNGTGKVPKGERDADAAVHDTWPGGLASFSGDLASFSKLIKGMAKINDVLEEIIRREGKYIGGGVYEITINGEIYRVRSCDPFRVRDVEAGPPVAPVGGTP